MMKQNQRREQESDLNLEGKISCVIPTYNRCPYSGDEIRNNPPWWAANSLFEQQNIQEIIFINDASQDYFQQTIDAIKRKRDEVRPNVNIQSSTNQQRQGSGKSRNIGVNSASNNYIFFMDDDCVIVSDKVLYNLKYAFDTLKERGVKVGAMNLPVSGNSLESPVRLSSEIGKVNRKTGEMCGCYTKFPKEYLDDLDNFYLNKGREIFEPLEVEFMGGVFLCNRNVYQKVGGFPTTQWRNAINEEPELMFSLQKEGYRTFYLPSIDPSFRVFHCRFGDSEFNRIPYDMNVDGVYFNDILSASSNERLDTGNRVAKDEEVYSQTLSTMRLLFRNYDRKTGLNNLDYQQHSVNGNCHRAQIFKRAVADGLDLMKSEKSISKKLSEEIRQRYLN